MGMYLASLAFGFSALLASPALRNEAAMVLVGAALIGLASVVRRSA